jgi:hypothetical protein
MKASGIRIPIPWGHRKGANPVHESMFSAQDNASFIDDLEMADDGSLYMTAQVPPRMEIDADGDLIDPVAHTRVGEVSLAANSWSDGSGRRWDDAIRHIALVTLPVAHGAPGFEAVSMATWTEDNYTCFSLTNPGVAHVSHEVQQIADRLTTRFASSN